MRLEPDAVHVWPVRLHGSDEDLALFDHVLSADERERAARFAFPYLRRRYTFGRGTLRFLISAYSALPPADISFVYGPQGKPSLASPARLHFNASHSGEHAVFAFTLDCDIGVDIEAIRPIPELSQIASRFFCPDEVADLVALDEHRHVHAFSLCWSRKEAYIKAKGGGLSIPLNSFRVSLHPDEPVRFLGLPPGDATTPWTLQNLDVFEHFSAAVAYPARPRRIQIFPPADAASLLPPTAPRP